MTALWRQWCLHCDAVIASSLERKQQKKETMEWKKPESIFIWDRWTLRLKKAQYCRLLEKSYLKYCLISTSKSPRPLHIRPVYLLLQRQKYFTGFLCLLYFEIKHYDWMLLVLWQVLTNESALFQSWVTTLLVIFWDRQTDPQGKLELKQLKRWTKMLKEGNVRRATIWQKINL